jgi:hypothetical protein
MTRLLAIYRLILGMHAWQDRMESWEEWEARADMIAVEIDAQSRDNEEAAWLIVQGQHESGFSKAIHEGKLTRRRCRCYWGLWQVEWHFGVPPIIEVPSAITRTRVMAVDAIDNFRSHRTYSTLKGAIRGYGGYSRLSPVPHILARRVRAIERSSTQLLTKRLSHDSSR